MSINSSEKIESSLSQKKYLKETLLERMPVAHHEPMIIALFFLVAIFGAFFVFVFFDSVNVLLLLSVSCLSSVFTSALLFLLCKNFFTKEKVLEVLSKQRDKNLLTWPLKFKNAFVEKEDIKMIKDILVFYPDLEKKIKVNNNKIDVVSFMDFCIEAIYLLKVDIKVEADAVKYSAETEFCEEICKKKVNQIDINESSVSVFENFVQALLFFQKNQCKKVSNIENRYVRLREKIKKSEFDMIEKITIEAFLDAIYSEAISLYSCIQFQENDAPLSDNAIEILGRIDKLFSKANNILNNLGKIKSS